MRKGFLISGLVLLVVANLLAVYGFRRSYSSEGFANYFVNAAGAGNAYKPMGPFDNVRVPTGNPSSWKFNTPNEPTRGPFALGPDSLFMFKNNQCKPECCPASFACDGGCVCTTPDQRNFINSRGGNRTVEDGF